MPDWATRWQTIAPPISSSPLNTGYFFGNAAKKRAEHGGFTDDDTHVATIVGSTGADKFYLAYNGLPTSANTVGDFEVGIDKMLILGVSGVSDFSKVTLTAKGTDTLVAAGGKDLALLTGIQSSSLNASSFAFV